MKSWKTTLAGIGAIGGGLAQVTAGLTADPINPTLIMTGVTTIIGGIGLIFAKDVNVSNSQNPGEAKKVE